MLNKFISYLVFAFLIASCSQGKASPREECDLSYKINSDVIQFICDEKIVSEIQFDAPNIFVDTSIAEVNSKLVLIREGWENGFQFKIYDLDVETKIVDYASPYSSYVFFDVNGDNKRDFVGFRNIRNLETENPYYQWPEIFLFDEGVYNKIENLICTTDIQKYHVEILRHTKLDLLNAIRIGKFPLSHAGGTLSQDNTEDISSGIAEFLKSLDECDVRE